MAFESIPELVDDLARRKPQHDAILYRRGNRWKTLARQTFAEMTKQTAVSMKNYGVRPGERVGIVIPNSPEWLIADVAIQRCGAVSVPIHASLLLDDKIALGESAQLHWLCDANNVLNQYFFSGIPSLCGVFSFLGSDPGIDLFPDSRFVELRKPELASPPCSLPYPATIVFTSGTSGKIRGAMLSAKNLLWNAEATQRVLPFSTDGLVINSLPFSHIYARNSDFLQSMIAEVPLALAESIRTLERDLSDLQPTNMHCVPRFYQKVLHQNQGSRLRDYFGGRMQWLKAGGAALPASVSDAYNEAGLKLLQGYGMTEGSPVIATNQLNASRSGSIGLPLPGLEIRIADDQELLVRGPSVFSGYFQNQKATREILREGWLHTGDLVEQSEAGFLTLVGRKHDMITLSIGKKTAPAKIESILQSSPLIESAFVIGEGCPGLSALLFPVEASTTDIEIQCEVDRINQGLPRWEQIRQYRTIREPSVAESTLMTSTRKWIRARVQTEYQDLITELLSSMEMKR